MKYLPLVLLIAVILLILNWLYMPFEDRSEYQSTYTITAPATPTPSPTATPRPQTDEEMMKSLPYGEVVWATYGHESSYGKHDSCRSQGLYNGFGYFKKSDGSYECYYSTKQIAEIVSDWFVRRLDQNGYTIRQSLCLYQSGVATNDCPYASVTMQMMGGAK